MIHLMAKYLEKCYNPYNKNKEMIIDTNRVAAYLSGNFPPYYQAFPKIEFILILSSKAGNIFNDDKLQLIERHTAS